MWTLENHTSYAVERTWVLDRDARKSWVVVVKATFDIFPDGATELAKKQEDPLYLPEYSGEPGTSSLVYEADLIGAKPSTDFLINGKAYAPYGDAATAVSVTARVGSVISKTLKVFGDRYWEGGGRSRFVDDARPAVHVDAY